ncbi:hypothetical protein BWI93_05350 [Siphonobacter sp. BAB-5385]|uniref:hypothetical protein n=1 Tax=Siphonobacter sp. BAB-5385 TaxID=1864822 RepID=UPI000B9E3D9A|nr:hypothetical protein [Siphonobacter sp. BAB-5385]OZI09173.1 hypothetical protein BWI93_05350 [Siphonobacter sp. BAB-5385]
MKTQYYFLTPDHPVPEVGRYYVKFRKNHTVSSVHRVLSVKLTQQKKPVEGYICYTLKIERLEGLVPFAEFEFSDECQGVWVKGEEAYAAFPFDPKKH